MKNPILIRLARRIRAGRAGATSLTFAAVLAWQPSPLAFASHRPGLRPCRAAKPPHPGDGRDRAPSAYGSTTPSRA